MSNDMQATISADVSRAAAGLDKLTNSVKQLERSTNTNNRAHQQFQQGASNAFRTAGNHADGMAHKMREVAHAMALAGGEVGHISHLVGRFSRVANDGNGTVTRLAAAAGVAGLAFEAYNLVLEANVQRTEAAIKAEEAHAEAIKKGREAAAKQATAGASQADDVRKLAGLGGVEGNDRARDIAKAEHIPIEEVRKAMIASYKFKAEDRRDVFKTALEFRKSGAGTLSEGLEGIHKNPALLGRIRGGNIDEAAALLREKSITGRFGPGDVTELGRAQYRVSKDRTAGAEDDITDIENQTKEAQLDRFKNGGAQGDARKALIEARTPESAALGELNVKQQTANTLLERMAGQEGWLARILGALSAKGGSQTQLNRNNRAQGDAAFDDSPTGENQ